jgi:DNA helicase-2/ATP-dependent DNA helicase PcrA
VLEPVDSRDLVKAAAAIDTASGQERAALYLDFAMSCMTAVDSTLKAMRNALGKGSFKAASYRKEPALAEALGQLAFAGDYDSASKTLRTIKEMKGTVLYRRHLFIQMQRSIDQAARNSSPSLSEALLGVVEADRIIGRSIGKSCSGRTVILKGLEFEHIVVLQPDQMDVNNLYVAVTRGSKTLTLVTPQPVLRPAASKHRAVTR